SKRPPATSPSAPDSAPGKIILVIFLFLVLPPLSSQLSALSSQLSALTIPHVSLRPLANDPRRVRRPTRARTHSPAHADPFHRHRLLHPLRRSARRSRHLRTQRGRRIQNSDTSRRHRPQCRPH